MTRHTAGVNGVALLSMANYSTRGFIAAVLLATALVGCGGSGGTDSEPAEATQSPVAFGIARGSGGAGAPIKQEELVLLDATNSYDPSGHTLTFAWSLDQRPAGSTRTLTPTEVPHIVRLDPDLPGEYTATLVVSNGTAQGTVAVPFTVVPDPPHFYFPVTIGLYSPYGPAINLYDRWAVTVQRAGSNYPFTLEVFFNGVSQGPGSFQPIYGSFRGSGGESAWVYPITGYPGGEYKVDLVVRAGGQSATFSELLTFPPCDPPDTAVGSQVRTCPPS